MLRVATVLGIAAAVMLLVPWQICDCNEDGPHLQMLWDHAPCETHSGAPASDDEPDDECHDLFYLAGTQGGGDVELPMPDVHHLALHALQSVPAFGMDRGLDGEAPPACPSAGPRAPTAHGTRLLI